MPVFRLESVWRHIGRRHPRDWALFKRLLRVTDEADNFAAYAAYRRTSAEEGGGGGGGGPGNRQPEVAFVAPLLFFAFYVGERRRGASSPVGDVEAAESTVAEAVLRRVESEALEMETREKLRLLCLSETRHDSRWACLMLRGWANDRVKAIIPCLAVRSSKLELFVASQRPNLRRGGGGGGGGGGCGGGWRVEEGEEEEEASVRMARRVASALDKFVRCDFGDLESRLLMDQCAALGFRFQSDARLRTKLLRSPCNREKDNLLISFLHEPVCELTRMWATLK